MQGCTSLGVIRKVAAASGTIATLAGQPTNPDGSDPCCDGCFDPPECVRAFVVDYVLPGVSKTVRSFESVTAVAATAFEGDSA